MFAEGRLNDLVVCEIVAIIDRMSSGDIIRLATFGEIARGVGARGVEQSVVCRSANEGCRYQRFRDQARHRVGDRRVVRLRLGGDGGGSVEREHPDEDRQPAQDQLIEIRQQVVAPVEHRVQGLVSGQRSAPALPE